MKTFEELLDGRKLHELTDAEIDEIIAEMQPQELEKLNTELKKSGRKKKAPSTKQKKNATDFEKAIWG
jgi:Mg/Co/Ni transporter MgtE